jgi:hypothetical protein
MSLLDITGEADAPRGFEFADLASLAEQVPDIGALVPGKSGGAVRLRAILDRVGARGDFLLLRSSDGFSICVPRAAVAEALVAYRLGEGALPEKQGGPVRFYVARDVACDTGEVDACANVKHLVEIRLTRTPVADTHQH